MELRFAQGKLRGRGEGDDMGSHPRLLIICQFIGKQRVDDGLLHGVPAMAMAAQNLQSLHGHRTILVHVVVHRLEEPQVIVHGISPNTHLETVRNIDGGEEDIEADDGFKNLLVESQWLGDLREEEKKQVC